MQAHASACVASGADLEKAKSCLASRGLDVSISGRDRILIIECGPYWGYPLVQSCGSLEVLGNGNHITTWRVHGSREVDAI